MAAFEGGRLLAFSRRGFRFAVGTGVDTIASAANRQADMFLSHGKADRYGTKMARLTAMAVIEADFWSRQAKAKAKGLVAIFSPTRNACFRCHNGQPCHFGATAVGLADPEAQRSALPTRRHSGHARHPQRGRPARKRTLPSPTSLPARRAPSGGVANARKARDGPPILAACHPSGGAGRPPGPPPGADAGRHGPARPPLWSPGRHGSHRPSPAATGRHGQPPGSDRQGGRPRSALAPTPGRRLRAPAL